MSNKPPASNTPSTVKVNTPSIKTGPNTTVSMDSYPITLSKNNKPK